jgi:hypothetical protein
MVGHRLVPLLLSFVLCVFPVSASLLEEVSDGEVSYQFDGDTHHDAPDACDQADPAWNLAINGTTGQTDGLLAPPDDASDVFVLDVAATQVGERLRIDLSEATASIDLAFNIFAPLCLGDVFAPENQPFPLPSPAAPADGEQQASLPRGADPLVCSDEWTFLIGGLGTTPAPATLYAAWTDGQQGEVPLSKGGDGYGVYGPITSDAMLEGAWINLPADWLGPFEVATGDCDATDGGAVFGEPARMGDDWISFTPIRAGAHEIVITPAPIEVDVPTTIPASCHWCVPQIEEAANQVAYRLLASLQE